MARHSAALLAALACIAPAAARAGAYDVEARTEAQVYTLRRFTDDPNSFEYLSRRRLTQYLDLAGFELVPGDDVGLDLTMRFDVDFGVGSAEAAGIDGAWRDRLQLLNARLHWNGLFGGRVDLALGRMVSVDPSSFYSFDGGKLTVRPLRQLAVTGYGGLEVQGSSFLGSSTFQPDGVRESDARRLALGYPTVPCPQQPDRYCADASLTRPSPTYGARVALVSLPGNPGNALEVGYRRVMRDDTAGKLAIIEEHATAGLRYGLGPVFADGALDYDMFLGRLAVARGGLKYSNARWLTLALDGGWYRPTFAADSIFAIFNTSGYEDARLRADVALPAGFRAYAWAGAQRYEVTDFDKLLFNSAPALEPGVGGGASWQRRTLYLLADFSQRNGAQGRQTWGTFAAHRGLLEWLALDLRLTAAGIRDPNVSSYTGDFYSGQLMLSGRLERRTQLSFLVEDSAGPYTKNDLRAYAFFTVGADWDGRVPGIR